MSKPKVFIENEVYRKIMYWVNKSNYEVSGLGTLTVEADNTLRVRSAMLLPQKNGATHTDIEPEDVGKLMFQLRNEPGDLRFWWHSHVDMPVFWSGTDMDTIRKIGAGGWFLSTVFNKKRELRSAFYSVNGMNTPWGLSSLFLDELETSVGPFVDPLQEIWDAEYTKNVTNVYVTRPTYGYGGYGDQWEDEDGTWVPGQGYVPKGTVAATTSGRPPALLPPGQKRPPGVSKREWKKMRRAGRQGGSLDKDKPVATINPLRIASAKEEFDDYGFCADERKFLAQQGWDESDFDELVDYDVTPAEMLFFAALDVTPIEITAMIDHGWSIADLKQHFNETRNATVADATEETETNDDAPVVN